MGKAAGRNCMKTWDQVAIVGVGLIGGSIGQALLRRGLARKVVGIGHRAESLQAAEQVGAVTSWTTDLAAGVAEAQLVVVCTPVEQIAPCVRQVAAACRPGTLITDAGSTKRRIMADLTAAAESDPQWQRQVRFVGSHPLAGNEKRGPQAAIADLFEGRVVVVTPATATTAADLQTITEFWNWLGAHVVMMSADDHDRAVAATSHLPHLVASAIAAATPNEYVTLTGGGWLDTTRIAAGDPHLWRQILLSNRDNVLAALGNLQFLLDNWKAALEQLDASRIEKLLTEAKRIRDAVGS